MWPRFDWSITLGTLIHLVALLVGFVWAWVKMRDRLVAIETKLAPVWAWWVATGPQSERPLRARSLEEMEQEIRALQYLVERRREGLGP